MNVRTLLAFPGWFIVPGLLLVAPYRGFTQCCPPVVTQQPTNQTVFMGTNVFIGAGVYSLTAATYQWRLNGTNIPGAVSSNCPLANIQAWQAGAYSVAITNSAGYAISSNAMLTVVIPTGVVVGWNFNGQGQSTTPPELGPVKGIAGGGNHSLALRNNGNVVAWGYNFYGQCNVPPGLSNVMAVAAGQYFSMALKSNGTVSAWGFNGSGQTNVPLWLNDAVAIAAGSTHCLALRSNGTVVTWGSDFYGQSAVPVGLSNVVAVAGGASHSLALKSDGTVVAWGTNSQGQLAVPANLSNAVAIAAGDFHSVALRSTGSMVAWGNNSLGQTNVAGTSTAAIAAGGNHTLALRNTGLMAAWGSISTIPPALTNVVAAIACGALHNLALTSGGSVVITVQPNRRIVALGERVAFNVMAAGTPALHYQWRRNGLDILSATANNYTINSAQLSDVGEYSCVVTNEFGPVTSATATLTVTSPLLLTALGFDTSGFRLRLTGMPGPCVIQISPNLTSWFDALTTNLPPSGTLILSDPTAFGDHARAYRAHQP